jgi:arylsulfatase A-like enzyme
MVMFDSLNRHMLSPYGCAWTHTPNFKRLMEKTVTFDNVYVGSMPCMPARRELHTGRHNFLHRGWGPLEPYDDSFPERLKKSGIYTHLVSDHYHYWEDGGMTYHHRYTTWENIRGQEGDRWKGEVADPEIPEHLGRIDRFDWINRRYMDQEEKTPLAQTFAGGLEFIEKNHEEDNWFLQIEAFDPHEPFFTLEHWKEKYPHDWQGPHFDWPRYDRVVEGENAVEHVIHEYAALLTQCDHYLGKVLDAMDTHDLWKDTMLIVNTDHGFLLGEHDWWAKNRMPFYNEVAHIPLFIWDPRSRVQNERREGLVQMIDMAPTLLDFFGVDIPVDMQGLVLKDHIAKKTPTREAVIYGIFGGHVNVTDGRYVYMLAPREDNAPLNHYTHMPTHMRSRFHVEEMRKMQWHEGFSFTKSCPVMKIPASGGVRFEDLTTRLYDLQKDPGQKHPFESEDIEKKMRWAMIDIMRRNDAPEEQFRRLDLKEAL